MKTLENVTIILMVAFFLAYILNPAVNRLESWGLQRSLASLALLFSGLLLFVLFLLFFVPSVAREIASFAKKAPRYLDALETHANLIIQQLGINIPHTPDEFKQLFLARWKQVLPQLADPMAKIASSVLGSTISVISFIFYALLVPIISYYFMVSFEHIRETVKELIPPDTRPALVGKLQQIDTVLAAFVRGQLTVSIILAVLYSIGFIWIGIDLAIVLGVTSGLLFVIPYFGTMIGIVGGSLMALAKFGDMAHVGYVLGWIAFVQLLEGYVITPRVVGHAIGLNPVVYILALVVGGNLFGLVGMLIAIPVTAVLKVSVGVCSGSLSPIPSVCWARRSRPGIMNSGMLFVVATPIGNLEDITIRGLEVLRTAEVIACEDTRKSRILLQRWGISARLVSLHKFSESRKTEMILGLLEEGQKVAVISDAGTPAVSDPGNRVVRAALDKDFKVVPIPGPSSIIAALSVSGMDCSTFTFLGFAPRKGEQKRSFFERLSKEGRTCIFLESPHRIVDTFKVGAETLGERRVALMRELTKLHEEILVGTAREILSNLRQRESVKGEIVIVVEGNVHPEDRPDLEEIVRSLIEEGLSGKRLADEARLRFNVKKSEVYEIFLKISKQPDDRQSNK